MAKNNKAFELANELEQTLNQRAEIEQLLVPVIVKEKELRQELAVVLEKVPEEFVLTETGLGFGLVRGKTSFKVMRGKENEALQWAIKKYPSILSINATKFTTVIKPMLKAPSFVERYEAPSHVAIKGTESND